MPVSAQFKRYASYTVGMILLAIGLTLTAQTHLGTSPLTSVAYVLAEYTHNTFSNMTLLMFTLFVLAQIALARKPTARKTAELLLQIPLSLVFTRVMGAVQRFVDLSGCTLPVRLLCLFSGHSSYRCWRGNDAASTVDSQSWRRYCSGAFYFSQ